MRRSLCSTDILRATAFRETKSRVRNYDLSSVACIAYPPTSCIVDQHARPTDNTTLGSGEAYPGVT
jgi:hypothetical protein